MDLAYDHIFWLLSQCFFIAILLLALFRLRIFFGLGLLYITLGVFQFLQSFTASTFSVEIASNISVSSGSMVFFTGSLFAVLIIYIQEDALETRKVIYGLLVANLSLALLMFLFTLGMDEFRVNNIYNIPKELLLQNSLVLALGTIILLIDTIAIIFTYNIISKYIPTLFLRILFTMIFIVLLDTFLFSMVMSRSTMDFQNNLISGILSKGMSAFVYSGIFAFYLMYFEQGYDKSTNRADSYKDIFNTLTFRQKYEDVSRRIKIKTKALEDSQKIARLGTYTLDITNNNWNSSTILDEIFGIDQNYKRDTSGWINMVDPRDQAMMYGYFSKNILINHEKFNKEYRILRINDGQERWVKGFGKLEYDDDKNPIKLIGTIQDITERKIAELKLLKSENKFRELHEKSGDAILMSENGIYIECNQAAVDLFGYNTKEDFFKKNPSDISPIFQPDGKKSLDKSIEMMNEALIKGAHRFEWMHKNSKGEELPVEILLTSIVNDPDRKILHGVIRDISEWKKIKGKLIKSEERFQRFANASFEGIGIAVNGIIRDANNRLAELTGYPINEIIDNPVAKIIHPDDQSIVKDIILEEKEGIFEFRLLRKDGKSVWVQVQGRNIVYNGEKARIASLYDISDRKKIKEQLIKSEERFSKAYHNNPIPIFISAIPDGEFMDINPKFEQISGRSRKELIGKKVTELGFYAYEEDRVKLFKELEKKGRLNGYEIEFKVKSGEIRDCLMYSEIIDIDGKPCLLSIVNDITEKKRSDKELKKQNKELKSLSKELSIKHDLLLENERKFKNLFDKNPVSLWIEDVSEVKQLIDEKKTQTNNLKKYLDENSDFVFECVSKVKILDVNNISLDLFGVSNTEELTNHLSSTFNENSFNIFKKELLAIASNKKEFSAEAEFLRSNGETLKTLIKLLIIDDDYKKAIVSIVDITELSKAKEEIEESEKRFRELYEKSGDAILIIENGIFVECNQATVDMLEYESKEEFLNSHPSKLSPIFQQDGQKSFDKAIDMMNIAVQQGTHRFEWMHTKKNGENFPVEVLLTAISDEPNNQVIHTVWRDITDRKNAELGLKMSERELRKSQEIAQLGTFNLELSSELIKTSPIFDSIVGFRPNRIKYFDQWRKIVHPEDLDENKKMLEACIKEGKQFDREFRILTETKNELKWIHGLGEIIYKDGVPDTFRGNIQDITERKLNELEVKLNEKKLIEAQKIANIGTYEIDLRTNSVTTSELYNSILGIKKTPKNNKGWWKSITHPEDFESSEYLWKECIRTGTTYKDEYRIINDKNEIKWIYDVAEIKLEKGIPTAVVGTIQDITERKLFEEKIKRSDSILSQVNSLVQVVDKRGNITYASPSFKTILGFEPEDMLGQGWWIKTTSDLAAATKLRDSVLNVVNNNTPIPEEIKNRWIKAENGQFKLFDWVNSKSEDGSLIFIGIEITEKQEREKQFKTLTETAQDAIILVDHNGIIFEWNKSSEETFGYSKNEVMGKSITALMPKKYRTQYKKGFNKVMKRALKETFRNNIVEGVTKEGKVFPMELSISFWESKGENVYCYFIRDITEREREEKIKEVLFNITKKANDTLTLDKFFYFIKTELGKLINTNNFFIALYDEESDMISTPYMVDEMDTGDDFPKGETLTGYIIDTKKALLTRDVVKEKNKGDKVIGIGPESQCWLGVPILLEEKAIGAIVVQSYIDKNAYTEEDVILLELVATNISQVIKQTKDFEKINMLNQALIQTPAMVMITNEKVELEYVNPSFTTITGFKSDEVLGKNPKFLSPEVELAEFYKEVSETIDNGGFWQDETENIKKDGGKIKVSVSIAPVKDANGEITHYVVVADDVTEKRKLQRQFISAFIDAQEVEKQNFGEELHDGISQILSAESMYINLLIEQNQDRIHDEAKFLPKIKELNNRAVNETRTIAHGLMSSQLKQSGLLIAVENICIDFNSTKNIKFLYSSKNIKEEEISNEIKTNLFRIVQELTTNLNRYSSAKEAAILFSKSGNDKLNVIVKDNGIGMDYNKIKKERKVTGLKNVERRIAFLNGSFEVKSAPKKGTVWNIEIPLS